MYGFCKIFARDSFFVVYFIVNVPSICYLAPCDDVHRTVLVHYALAVLLYDIVTCIDARFDN